MNELNHSAPIKNQAVTLATEFSPPQLLQQAIIKKSDIAVIERLSALAERWEEARFRREAELAYASAMAEAKLHMPVIAKNRHVQFSSKKQGASDTDYWHEDLAAVVDAATPVLAAQGLFFTWKLEQPAKGEVKVTCILKHRGGHQETNDITAGVDLSGNKNHIQAIKSAVTYLERLTALASLGMAARNQDDDGRFGGIPQQEDQASGVVITDEQIKHIEDLLERKGRSLDKLLAWCRVDRLEDIPISFYDDILNMFAQVPDTQP